jgi:hypothetical protein
MDNDYGTLFIKAQASEPMIKDLDTRQKTPKNGIINHTLKTKEYKQA